MIDDQERKARFAYALSTARKRRGLTPPQLAAQLGKQRATINAWENPAKTAVPSILDLGPLCEALGVDANLFSVLPPIPAWEGEAYLMATEREEVDAIKAVIEPILLESADREPTEPRRLPDGSTDGSGRSRG